MDGIKKIIYKDQLYRREVFWIGSRFVPTTTSHSFSIGTTFHDVYTVDYPTVLGRLLGLRTTKSLFSKKRELVIPPSESWIDLVKNTKIKNSKLSNFLDDTSKILWQI